MEKASVAPPPSKLVETASSARQNPDEEWSVDELSDEGESEMDSPNQEKAAAPPQSDAEDEDNARIEETRPDMDIRITDIIPEIDLPRDLEGRYGEDPFFKLVLKDPSHYANFEVLGVPYAYRT